MTTPRFHLGTHQLGWLNHPTAPRFLSDTQPRGYRRPPVTAAALGRPEGHPV